MTSPSDEPTFLTMDEVKRLHELSIERHGGSLGVRDEGLLESAVMQPQQSAFGQFAHPTVGSQAAAYLFHISSNHPFVDGNKRTGLLACETFLKLNGKELGLDERQAYEVTMKVAAGEMNKERLTQTVEANLTDLRPEKTHVQETPTQVQTQAQQQQTQVHNPVITHKM